MKNHLTIPDDIFDQTENKQEGFTIDFKRIWSRAVRYWYVILLSLIIALLIAYLQNRYAARIYPVTASILIKETQENSEGKLLYNNPLVSYYRNYLNELYIIRSYPLIQKVIEDLKFTVSFYKEGDILTSETYDQVPVEVTMIDVNGRRQKSINFVVLDKKRYQLGDPDDGVSKNVQVFNFYDTVQYDGLVFVVEPKEGKDLDVYEENAYILTYKASHLLTGSYVSKLRVSWAEQGAGVIDLHVNGPDPVKEMDFLNGLIQTYQQYDLDKKSQSASRAIEFINSQLRSISDSLGKVELQVEQFKDKNVLTDLSSETMRLYQRLEDLEMEKARISIRENYYQYIINYIQKGQNLDQVILPSSIGMNDAILSSLLSTMVQLQLEIKAFGNTGKLENPAMAKLRERITMIKDDIIESVRNQRATDQIQLDFYSKQIKAAEQQLNHLPIAERQYISIQRNYALLENLYVFLMQKRAEADISKASTTTDIVVVNPPMLAGGPIAPKTTQNYMIALALGLMLPFFAFVLSEFFNNKIQSREDVEKITNMPFLGGIGHKKTDNNLVVSNSPKSAVAESFRALRSNLSYFTGGRDKATFMITSSISGEGKTFTTINLSSVLALSGKSVLIIGADMRRPKIFSDFKLNNDTGLSSYLASFKTFDEVVQSTSQEGLFMVSGGPVPPNPSELLLSGRMEEFMREAIKRFDYVLLDTPPLGIVTDAFVLARFADHTVFVVRQNYTPKSLLKSMHEYYSTGRIQNISVILNDIHKSGPGYGYGSGYGYGYSYSYRNGYGYYQDDQEERKSLLSVFFPRKKKSY